MSERTIKGTSVTLTLDLVRREHGEEGLAKVVAAVPEHVREQLPVGLKFLPASTWPFEVWAELLLAAETLFGGERSFARLSAREGYEKLFRTTYKNWVRPGDPRASIRQMPHMWEQVTSGLGDYELVEEGEHLAIRVRLRVAPRYRAITEERVAGTLEAMIHAAGGQATITRTPHTATTELTIHLGDAR
jgi:hypothetical protein